MISKKEFKVGFLFYIDPIFWPYKFIKLLLNKKKIELTESEKCEKLIELYLKDNPLSSREEGERFIQKSGLCIKTHIKGQ